MKRPVHLRLVPSEAKAAMPAQPRVPAPPDTQQRRKRPPLLPARKSASIRKSLRRALMAELEALDACVASTCSDGSAAAFRVEHQHRKVLANFAELRESLRREHNGMRWKRGLSYDEN